MTFARPTAQRRLRLLLACAGAVIGTLWGDLALMLAHDPLMLAMLAGHAAGAYLLALAALLAALPVGSLMGALPLDLLSHTYGRRPAALASSTLVAIASLLGLVWGQWGQVVSLWLAGWGVGGWAIIAPKLAHELAERGHRRLIPRLAPMLPAGAGIGMLCAESASRINTESLQVCMWIVPLVLTCVTIMLMIGLPESPHWYVASGNIEAAHASLRRMTDPLEAAIAIDWVMMDAGMDGEQRPLSAGDMRVDRVRRTVMVGALLELIQVLPLGLTAVCLAPALVAYRNGGVVPLWALAVLAAAWLGMAGAARRRRPERLLMAWVLSGTGLAACGLSLLVVVEKMTGVGAQIMCVVVALILVAAHYVCCAPACMGGTDPLIPPWLARSQRRSQALARPLVQLAAVAIPVGLLAMGASGAVVLAVCLGLQVVSLVLLVVAVPRINAALR